MFGTLLESSRRRQRHPAAVAASAFFHLALVASAIRATSHAAPAAREELSPQAIFIAPVEPTPPAHEAGGTPAEAAATAEPARSRLPALDIPSISIEIPITIPGIDFTRAVTPDAFRSSGLATGFAGTGDGLSGSPGAHDAYVFAQVESMARLADGNAPPPYPATLRSAGVTGRVLVSFVIDSTGRVDTSSVRIVESSHSLFSDAVTAALRRMKYIPATIGGRSVRVWVQQPFEFALEKRRDR